MLTLLAKVNTKVPHVFVAIVRWAVVPPSGGGGMVSEPPPVDVL